jgi:hypothetical protein
MCPALLQIYTRTDGTFVPGNKGTDHNGFAFWRLRDIRADAQHGNVFVFADYMEESWWYGIALGGAANGNGRIFLLGDVSHKPLFIAKDLREFATLYVRNDPRLYPRGAADM